MEHFLSGEPLIEGGEDAVAAAANDSEGEFFDETDAATVSTIKELTKRWYPKVGIDRPSKNGQHRAMEDIKASVRELQFYRSKVFLQP